MRFDTLNPVTLLPAQPTEAGTPVLSRLPFLLANVVPMPRLPDDGSKPDDKHSKNEEATPGETSEDQEEDLPEIFQLIKLPDFRHLFEYYYFDKDRKIETFKMRMRILRGVQGDVALSDPVKRSKKFEQIRTVRYGNALYFHYTRPGKRFIGEI